MQADGLAALEKLDTGLLEFQALIDAKDKQAVPIKQREVLEYVGQVEAAMVKGFPFEVPKEYADRPLLKVRHTGWTQRCGAARGGAMRVRDRGRASTHMSSIRRPFGRTMLLSVLESASKIGQLLGQ
jgi:hypothetical protein